MKKIFTLALIIFSFKNIDAQIKREVLDFEFADVMLNGVLNMPETTTPKGIIMIVHGSGRTNALAQELHYDVRHAIVKAGYATYMWDKMGCGKSGGTFDYNQPVHNSAMEVIAAIKMLQEKQIPGSNEIGLWGISRAGWINPIVINEYKDIKFWISVSGVDEKENFKYLLEQNLRINGHSEKMVEQLMHEYSEGNRISYSGGSFAEYQAATKNLQQNEFWSRFLNGTISEDGYYAYQKKFMKEKLDAETGLLIYIENFDSLLNNVRCPVLALFGEKDMNVDWIQTKTLYQNTIAENTDLTIRSFPDGNHNLFKCKTGGFYEFEDDQLPWIRCDGFLESITEWLNALE